MSTVVDVCGFCPRLCRHVCPVVVATARESATPTAIVSAVRLAEGGAIEASIAEAALAMCNGCGACTRHCALSLDVAEFVREWRPRPATAPLPALPLASGRVVRVEIGAEPAERAAGGVPVVWSADGLGHAAWKAGDSGVAGAVALHFAGWTVRTGSFAVAEVLAAASSRVLPGAGPIEVIPDPPPEGAPRFTTCWEGARGSDGQIACCGAREGFEASQPAAAKAMAREVVVRMGDREHTCADSRCAGWLREAGGNVRGPDADESG
ncbi:hypothetical protein LBMAG42_33310 [Deltaproteobacteria bacterium]|nr:hypothetical protein LBMAG42_33310 [Deltaproteobacteria bacterium]